MEGSHSGLVRWFAKPLEVFLLLESSNLSPSARSFMIDYQSVPLQNTTAEEVLNELVKMATSEGYVVEDLNATKPWGGYVRFSATNASQFIEQFFRDIDVSTDGQLSPKFLVALPHTRLSWQRHQRRAEVWKFLTSGAVAKNMDPNSQPVLEVKQGEVVTLQQGESHRLIAPGDDIVLVAEIWQHTDPAHPSNEEDIERLEDDYNR